MPGGKFGISLAIVACGTIIGLLVIPFSPASLNMVEWSIVIGWLAIGLALMLSPIPAKSNAEPGRIGCAESSLPRTEPGATWVAL